MNLKNKWIAILALSLSAPVMSWDGTDTDSGNSITIESGNLVRPGESIEYYDWDDGEYYSVTIDDISRYGNTVEIEATNDDTGEYILLEMDD